MAFLECFVSFLRAIFCLAYVLPYPPPPRFKDKKSKSLLLSLGKDLAKAESSFKFKTICFRVRPVYICFFFISFSYFFEDEEETNEITKSERFAERLRT